MKRSHIETWLSGLETPSPPHAPISNKRRQVAPLRSTQLKADQLRYSLRSLRPMTRQQTKMAAEKELEKNTRQKTAQKSSANVNTGRVEEDDTNAERVEEDDTSTQQQNAAQPPRRRVGRPRKNPAKNHPTPTEVSIRSCNPFDHRPDFPPPSSPIRTTNTKTSSKSKSPSRISKGIKRSEMVNLNPSIKFRDMDDARDRMPSQVKDLMENVIDPLIKETKVVPPGLKEKMIEAFDTSFKLCGPLNDSELMPPNQYSKDEEMLIWRTVFKRVKKAKNARLQNAPESQWCSFIIPQLLDLLDDLQQSDGIPHLEILDLTTSSIDPIDLCPYHDDGNIEPLLNKKIDFAVGLYIPPEQTEILENGNYCHGAGTIGSSINQLSTWGNYVPIFLNIEVKKTYVSEDPLIQLGVWIAAEFRKREWEGYDMRMPVFAIEIAGHQWNLYCAYASNSTSMKLDIAGPVPMGTTESLRGVFKLLHVLTGLAHWGHTEYRSWFEKEILLKAS